jgi:hypothetical protein
VFLPWIKRNEIIRTAAKPKHVTYEPNIDRSSALESRVEKGFETDLPYGSRSGARRARLSRPGKPGPPKLIWILPLEG